MESLDSVSNLNPVENRSIQEKKEKMKAEIGESTVIEALILESRSEHAKTLA